MQYFDPRSRKAYHEACKIAKGACQPWELTLSSRNPLLVIGKQSIARGYCIDLPRGRSRFPTGKHATGAQTEERRRQQSHLELAGKETVTGVSRKQGKKGGACMDIRVSLAHSRSTTTRTQRCDNVDRSDFLRMKLEGERDFLKALEVHQRAFHPHFRVSTCSARSQTHYLRTCPTSVQKRYLS